MAAAERLIADAEMRVRLNENSARLPIDYRHRLQCHCIPFFKNMPVAAIDARKLREFKGWLADKSLKAATIDTIMSFVSMVLKLAETDGDIRQRPNVPRSRHVDCPRPAFSRDQYIKLLSFLKKVERGTVTLKVKGPPIDKELRYIITFMVNSFLRPGDIFVLRNKHVEIINPGDGGPRYLRLNPPSSKGHNAPIITMPKAVEIYARALAIQQAKGFSGPEDFVFLADRPSRQYAKEMVRRRFTAVLVAMGMKENAKGAEHTMYSLRHSAIVFRLLNGKDVELLTLARNCRTSVEMIDRFYASSLTAEMNLDKLHSFKRETRYLV